MGHPIEKKHKRRPPFFTVVVDMVRRERQRQIHKWGHQCNSDPKWLLIVSEEVGEASKAILHASAETFDGRVKEILSRERDEARRSRPPDGETGDPVMDEVVQVAAVCFAWLEQNVAALLGEEIDAEND